MFSVSLNEEVFDKGDDYFSKMLYNMNGKLTSPQNKKYIKMPSAVTSNDSSLRADQKFLSKEKIMKPTKKSIRMDANGIEITKKNKKNVKVTFIDQITDNKLAEIIDVISYKKENYIFFTTNTNYAKLAEVSSTENVCCTGCKVF